MAYSKLPKVIQDFGLGFQSVNQAQENAETLHDALASKHEDRENTFEINVVSFGGRLISGSRAPFGRHEDPLIPRGIAVLKLQTYSHTPSYSVVTLAGDPVSSTGVFSGVKRLTEGLLFVPLAAAPPYTYCEAHPHAGAGTVPRLATALFILAGTNGAPQTGVLVSLRALDTGIWSPADYDVMLTVFSPDP